MKNLGLQRRYANRPGAVERAKDKLLTRGRRPPLDRRPATEVSARAVTPYERMTALALSFPEVRKCCESLVVPWTDAAPLLRAIRGGGFGHGCLCSLKFLVSVWNPDENGKKFDLHEALGVWDSEHRAAFLAWVTDPWWP